MAQSFVKDSDAVLDFTINWTAWLAGDTIATSTWAAETGITIASSPAPAHTTSTATVWLSGGTVATTYAVTNTIVTAAGRTDERTIRIKVRER